ncbi:MAG: O-acetylhomoserine aminocarboxypropyltransferase/cysteine synthase [Thermoguttaceae bacterium]|nr:O-acetylhomoserine aminocarboxypropyltransferase/cysteine synthase [Thermoguttaceae bacterium]
MRLETICVQGCGRPKSGEPRQLPIIPSTTFRYETSEEMGKLFNLEASGYFYTRLANPTNDAVARKITALEGGTGGVLVSSGMAAVFYSLFNIVSAGDHIVASSTIYGGSYNLLSVTVKRMGIDVTFIEPDWTDDQIHAAFRPNTKAFFGETLANPALVVFDLERFAKIAHEHGVPLIVDNTFPTPIHCRPFEWGADIVVHSTTKYMDGHSAALGGVVVDSGKFDWDAHSDKFPGLTTPDESYHGLTYTKTFGLEGAYTTKLIAQVGRDLGSMISPFTAFVLNLGLETLALRIERHCENAQKVAEWLEADPRVSWVRFPGLKSDKYYDLAQKYMPQGSSGVMTFGVKGGREAAEKAMAKFKSIIIATHVADAQSCVLHPATTTHRQLSDAELLESGVLPDMVRLSVGIENVDDIIEDLDQALA